MLESGINGNGRLWEGFTDLITEYEGSTIKATERKLKPKDETHRKHTYYIVTDRGDEAFRRLEG